MNEWLNFGGDPDHRLDTGTVFRIRHHWEIRKVVSTDCAARRSRAGNALASRQCHSNYDVITLLALGGGMHRPSASSTHHAILSLGQSGISAKNRTSSIYESKHFQRQISFRIHIYPFINKHRLNILPHRRLRRSYKCHQNLHTTYNHECSIYPFVKNQWKYREVQVNLLHVCQKVNRIRTHSQHNRSIRHAPCGHLFSLELVHWPSRARCCIWYSDEGTGQAGYPTLPLRRPTTVIRWSVHACAVHHVIA